MTSLCIVGHGPSMTGSKRGTEIDSHPVLRMKKGYLLVDQFPEDYGIRTDYAGSTTAVLGDTIKGFPNANEYWGYIKAKYPDTPHEADTWIHGWRGVSTYLKQVVVPKELHFEWLKKYYDFRGSDEIRFSTGLGLILIALDHLAPKEIMLAGFDAITDPTNEHDSVQFSPQMKRKSYDWENNPPHDFYVEHDFLFGPIAEAYPTEIKIMA